MLEAQKILIKTPESNAAVTVHIVAQSHIDPAFMWNWDEGIACILNTLSEAVNKLERHPNFKFTSSSAHALECVRQIRPELFVKIQKLVHDKRWYPAGGMYVETDTNLPGGESLIRQALIGQQMFADWFGEKCETAYLIDSFGHPAELPKILKHCGFKYFVFSRPNAKEVTLPAPIFRWMASDGSEILAFHIPVSYVTYGDEVKRINDCLKMAESFKTMMCFFGLGDHGGGPTEEQLLRVNNFIKKQGTPEVFFSHPGLYFKEVEGQIELVFKGMLESCQIGCYSVAAFLKQAHDLAQAELLAVERAMVFAGSNSGKRLHDSWKNLLLCEFHDLLPGTSVEKALIFAERTLHGVATEAEREKVFAFHRFSRRIDTTGEGFVRFIVFNDSDCGGTVFAEYEPWLFWQSWGKYKLIDEEGKEIPWQRIHADAAAPAIPHLIIKLEMEPYSWRMLRVTGPEPDLNNFAPDEDGIIDMEYLELPLKKTLGELPALEAQVLADPTDTWSMKVHSYGEKCAAFTPVKAERLENGPLRYVTRIKSVFRNSELLTEYRTYNDCKNIDVHITVDWRENRHLLKIFIPSPFGSSSEMQRGIAFGSAPATREGREFCFHDWILLKPATLSADNELTGYAVLTGPGIHSADFAGDGIRLTLLRSPLYCHEEISRPYDAGPYHKCIDIGTHEFIFSLVPICNKLLSPAELTGISGRMGRLPVIVTTDKHAGSLPQQGTMLRLLPASVELCALKPAEDESGTVIRVRESSGIKTGCKLEIFNAVISFQLRPNALFSMKLIHDGDKVQAVPVDGLETIIHDDYANISIKLRKKDFVKKKSKILPMEVL